MGENMTGSDTLDSISNTFFFRSWKFTTNKCREQFSVLAERFNHDCENKHCQLSLSRYYVQDKLFSRILKFTGLLFCYRKQYINSWWPSCHTVLYGIWIYYKVYPYTLWIVSPLFFLTEMLGISKNTGIHALIFQVSSYNT